MAARKKKKAKPKFDVRIGEATDMVEVGPAEDLVSIGPADSEVGIGMAEMLPPRVREALLQTAPFGSYGSSIRAPEEEAAAPGWDVSIGEASLDPGVTVEIGEPVMAQDDVLSYMGDPVIQRPKKRAKKKAAR